MVPLVLGFLVFPAAAAQLRGLTAKPVSGGYELTLTSDASPSYLTRERPEGLEIDLPGARLPAGLPTLELGGAVSEAGAIQTPDGVHLQLAWNWWHPLHASVTPEASGSYRLVLDLPDRYEVASSSLLVPGLVEREMRLGTAAGPEVVRVLDVDLHAPDLRVAPGLARGRPGSHTFGREPVAAIAGALGAIAGVNGSYFSMATGEPAGLLVVDGRLLAGPIFDRAAFLATGSGPRMDRVALSGYVALGDGESSDLDGINIWRQGDDLVLYTRRWGPITGTGTAGAEVAVRGDQVVATGRGDLSIPPDGFVLSAGGNLAGWLATLHVGDTVSYHPLLPELWKDLRWALGAGPELLHDGGLVIDTRTENFSPDIAVGRAPRTALGITSDDHLLMVTVDGRSPRESRGMTLRELGAFMASLGAADAINLDGGGSTTMVVEGRVVNHPSDGFARPVNNALLVFYTPLTARR